MEINQSKTLEFKNGVWTAKIFIDDGKLQNEFWLYHHDAVFNSPLCVEWREIPELIQLFVELQTEKIKHKEK